MVSSEILESILKKVLTEENVCSKQCTLGGLNIRKGEDDLVYIKIHSDILVIWPTSIILRVFGHHAFIGQIMRLDYGPEPAMSSLESWHVTP